MSIYSGSDRAKFERDTIELDRDNYYKLLAAKIILDTFKNCLDICRKKFNDNRINKVASTAYNVETIQFNNFSKDEFKNEKKSKVEEYVKSRKFLNIKRW